MKIVELSTSTTSAFISVLSQLTVTNETASMVSQILKWTIVFFEESGKIREH